MQRGRSPSSRGSRGALLNPRGNSSTSRGRGRGAPSFSRMSNDLFPTPVFDVLLVSPKSQNVPVNRGNRKDFKIHSHRNLRIKGAVGDGHDEFDRGFTSGNSIKKPRRKRKSRRDDMYNRDIDFGKVGTASTQDQGSPFDRERLENAAKREAKQQIRGGFPAKGGGGGRGSTRGSPSIKSVRFSSPPIPQNLSDMARPSPEPMVNPIPGTSVVSPFGSVNSEATDSYNPFITAVNPFGTPQPTSTTLAQNPFEQKSQFSSALQNSSKAWNKPNPFGSPSENPSPSVFGPSKGLTSVIAPNPFGTSATSAVSSTSIFGAPSGPAVSTTSHRSSSFGTSIAPVVSNISQRPNPFGAPSALAVSSSPQSSSPFTTLSAPSVTASSQSSNPFGAPSVPTLTSNSRSSNPFGTPSTTAPAFATSTPSLNFGTKPFTPNAMESTKPQDAVSKTKIKTQSVHIQSPLPSKHKTPPTAISRENVSKSKIAVEIENLLSRQGIVAPTWPTLSPGDPKQKAAVEAFWHTNKAYRAKVRICLMRNGYLDDPDKPKKLSEAIDFKGTCEEMCPDFEIITRIMEHSVENAEKELSPDGHTWWSSPQKMIKALARSAAGQDAPLPDDVRSPAALRRTLDYLIDTVLGDNDLDPIHTFLWNRTRAVRRDFVFQQASMSSEELIDQVYCLELITRFHVVALHQMSRENSVAEDFSEQQEVEQLGKALLSLIHAYEDCNAQGIPCENESEFKAYYIVFNSQNPAILEVVQDWGYNVWGESRNIRTAVNLVETLQNIWDMTGPLAPNSATNIAQNAFNRFFLIIEDPRVSYTMACFAEIHFNQVRKAALKTILAAYRKQRDQTKDWTLTELNRYLHFDDEQDILTFGTAYGLDFDTVNGETSLAFDQEDSIQDPFPRMKQPHSRKVVERKRGDHTLPETIHHNVFEDPPVVENEVPEDLSGNNSMFVPLSVANPVAELLQPPVSTVKLQTMIPPATAQSPFPTISTKTVDTVATNKPREAENQPVESVFKATNEVEKSTFSFTTPRPESNSSSTIDRASLPPIASMDIFNLPRTSLFAAKADAKIQSRDIVPSTSSPPNITPSLQSLFPGASPQPTATLLVDAPSRSPFRSAINATSQLPVKSLADLTFQPSPISATQTNDTLTKAPTLDPFPTKQTQETTPTKQLSVFASTSETKPQLQPPTSSGKFPEWVMGALGEKKSLIDEFIRYTVSNILDEVTVEFVAERKEREEQAIRAEADEFRRRFLATKYGYLWRKKAHLVWLRRKGNRARILRRQMAEESFRKSQVIQRQSAAEDFKRSQQMKKEKALREAGVQNDVQQSKDGLTRLVHNSRKSKSDTSPKTPRKTQPAADKSSGPSIHSHIRSPITTQEIQSMNAHPILLSSERRIHSPKTPLQTQPPKRTSPTSSKHLKSLSIEEQSQIMRDCLTAPGGSMIFHMPNWSAEADDERNKTPQPSGVKTPYFRLQARGILTLPDGTPLASSAAAHLFRRKRSLDSIDKNTTSETEEEGLSETGASSKIFAGMLARAKEKPRPPVVLAKGEDAATIVARAREIMVKDKEEKLKAKQKRRLSDDDYEEAMALSKRIREQMDEGAEWYRSEIQKTLSRSTSQ